MQQTSSILKRDQLNPVFFSIEQSTIIEWRIETGITDYSDAIAFMEQRAENIHNKTAAEMIWLVEHPPLYSAGTSAKTKDLLQAGRFPVYQTGRGGELTYHGPGQRIAYIMLDLKQRDRDIRRFIAALEEWAICSFAIFGLKTERREERVGIWVPHAEMSRHHALLSSPFCLTEDSKQQAQEKKQEKKIAAIGIRLRKWVSLHGIAFNIHPQLDHYNGIIPCGLNDYGITSLEDLGLSVTMTEFDLALYKTLSKIFGPVSVY